VAAHRCPSCGKRVRAAPYVRLQDRATRKVTSYHGEREACLEAATAVAERLGPDRLIVGFYHVKGCDPADRMDCRRGCFRVEEQQSMEGVA
jgi:hypothetical protein